MGCPWCGLRFVPSPYHLAPKAEDDRYRLHQNSLEDAGYVRFLSPVVAALQRWCDPGKDRGVSVLDYGAGPGPVLVELLTRAGFLAAGYDPCFGPPLVQGTVFDAVVSTEVFEHFREPARDLDRITALLRPGGFLVVLTSLAPPDSELGRWYYVGDPTHVVFYSERVFRYIAATRPFDLMDITAPNLIVLRRRADSA